MTGPGSLPGGTASVPALAAGQVHVQPGLLTSGNTGYTYGKFLIQCRNGISTVLDVYQPHN